MRRATAAWAEPRRYGVCRMLVFLCFLGGALTAELLPWAPAPGEPMGPWLVLAYLVPMLLCLLFSNALLGVFWICLSALGFGALTGFGAGEALEALRAGVFTHPQLLLSFLLTPLFFLAAVRALGLSLATYAALSRYGAELKRILWRELFYQFFIFFLAAALVVVLLDLS